VLLGDLCGSSLDHSGGGSWRISLAYHTGPVRVANWFWGQHVSSCRVTDDADDALTVTMHTAMPLPSPIGGPSFVGTMTTPTHPPHSFGSSQSPLTLTPR
jgi:hypothetical protein